MKISVRTNSKKNFKHGKSENYGKNIVPNPIIQICSTSIHYEVRIWRLKKKISALLWPLTAQCNVSCTPWNATNS